MPLSESEPERYRRHILLKEIGGAGQQALKAARVLIVGLGGLGNPVAQYLAAAGVGTLGLADDDCVDLSNLHRQILFGTTDIGRPKTEAAKARLAALNPHVELVEHPVRVMADNAGDLVSNYDFVADGSDNFATRLAVNDACFAARVPLVSAAVGRFEGQLATFKPWLKDSDGTPLPCYRSFMPAAPEVEEDCEQIGIVGALTGVMGCLAAFEIIKEITGAGETLAGRMLIYDALTARSRLVRLTWDPDNPLNGTAAC